jgi:hypothetical protein
LAEGISKISRKRITSIGTTSRVPRVTLVLACSEGLYTLSYPVASSLIHIQHQPEHHTYLQLTVPLCYQHMFLISDYSSKIKVIYKRGERTYSICIQHQFHKNHTTPVSYWEAIGYNYKSQLIILQKHSKRGVFIQIDYLAQVLELAIKGILEDFSLVTAELGYLPIFIEDGNPVYSHKSMNNPYALYKEKHRIQLLNHPSTSPDLNPIKKY